MTDLTSRKWIIAKGIMFALIVLMSAVGTIVYDDRWQRLVLLLICLCAACCFYYFLFCVLERYVGVEGRYAGIWDLLQRLWSQRRR